jgi:hypothetical protein
MRINIQQCRGSTYPPIAKNSSRLISQLDHRKLQWQNFSHVHLPGPLSSISRRSRIDPSTSSRMAVLDAISRDLTRSVRLITTRAIPVTNCYCCWVTTLFKVGVGTGMIYWPETGSGHSTYAFRRQNMSL